MYKIVFSELWYHQCDPLFGYNEGEIYNNHAYLLVFAFFYFFSFSLITPFLFQFIEDVGNMAVRISSPLCGWHDLWQTLDGKV